jgi:hypothetical protein
MGEPMDGNTLTREQLERLTSVAVSPDLLT